MSILTINKISSYEFTLQSPPLYAKSSFFIIWVRRRLANPPPLPPLFFSAQSKTPIPRRFVALHTFAGTFVFRGL